jgi:hypothetical protein
MRPFVKVAQGHGVGEQQIKLFRDLQPDRFFQFERGKKVDRPIRLDLACRLVKTGLRADPCCESL